MAIFVYCSWLSHIRGCLWPTEHELFTAHTGCWPCSKAPLLAFSATFTKYPGECAASPLSLAVYLQHLYK